MLISRRKQWDLLDDSVGSTTQSKQHRSFSVLFTIGDGLCYCHRIRWLLDVVGNISRWRLFIDTSSESVKVFFTAKHKSVALHSSGSLSTHERGVPERQKPTECSEVRPIQLGGHLRFQDVGHFHRVSGKLQRFPLLFVLLEQLKYSLYYEKRNWPLMTGYEVRVHNVN